MNEVEELPERAIIEDKETVPDVANDKTITGTSPVENERTRRQRLYPQLISTSMVSWLSVLVGYASAYSSPAEISMIRDLDITKHELSWIGSFLPVGAIVGSISGGALLDLFGRKKSLIVADFIFLAGWAINYFAWKPWNMYVSRLLCGYAVGITSFALPVYLAETVQHKIRGRLGLFPTAFGNFGILLCFTLGNLFQWKGLAGIGVVLTLPFLIVIWLIPETPRWYLSKKRINRALKSLQWLRGNDQNVTKEMDDLLSNSKHIRDNVKICTKVNIKAVAIVLGLMFFQQFSGINALIFYTTEIFEESGTSIDSSICTAILGFVNFISTFVATIFIDRLGRKALMYISCSAMANMLAILGVYFYLLNIRVNLHSFEWLPLTVFILYILGFSFGMGPVPWLVMSEILPAKVRASASSLSAAFNWSCTFLITKLFPTLEDVVGIHWIFWTFSVLMLCSLVFIKLCVPETKKMTLEDIERALAGHSL